MLRLFTYEIDHLADDRATDAETCQNMLVFKQDFVAYEPNKCIPFNPVPEQLGAWILGTNLQRFQSRDSCYQDGRIDNAPRPFSFLYGQRR